jgi:hypothetical protein
MKDRIAIEDVDDVIEAAAKAKEQAVETLSVEELQEVAAEIDIDPELVPAAIEEVRRRRAAALEAERREAQAATRRRMIASAVVGSLGVSIAVWALVVRGSVKDAHIEVERRRAQLVNVIERQRATQVQWEASPESPDKNAELSGAENRVRVERKRYDQAVADYRDAVSGPMGRWVASWSDYPDEVPYASEVSQW